MNSSGSAVGESTLATLARRNPNRLRSTGCRRPFEAETSRRTRRSQRRRISGARSSSRTAVFGQVASMRSNPSPLYPGCLTGNPQPPFRSVLRIPRRAAEGPDDPPDRATRAHLARPGHTRGERRHPNQALASDRDCLEFTAICPELHLRRLAQVRPGVAQPRPSAAPSERQRVLGARPRRRTAAKRQRSPGNGRAGSRTRTTASGWVGRARPRPAAPLARQVRFPRPLAPLRARRQRLPLRDDPLLRCRGLIRAAWRRLRRASVRAPLRALASVAHCLSPMHDRGSDLASRIHHEYTVWKCVFQLRMAL